MPSRLPTSRTATVPPSAFTSLGAQGSYPIPFSTTNWDSATDRASAAVGSYPCGSVFGLVMILTTCTCSPPIWAAILPQTSSAATTSITWVLAGPEALPLPESVAGVAHEPSKPQATTRMAAAVPTAAAILVVACGLLGSCATPATDSGRGSASGPARTHVIEVVAAEDVWGSIAAQIGGEHVHVVSIITNPNTDPHGYEPTAADARSVAESQLVVENGIGYDPWAPKLVKADGGTVAVLDVGNLLGIADGGNPHRWYNPTDVLVVVNQLVTEYQKLDPTDSAYFAGQRTAFVATGLEQYHALIASIASAYRGTPVGASESIFSMLAPALGLDLITPNAFLKDCLLYTSPSPR